MTSQHHTQRLNRDGSGLSAAPKGKLRIIVAVAAFLITGIFLLTVLFPNLSWSRAITVMFPFAQLIAFPVLLGGAIAVAGILLAGISLALGQRPIPLLLGVSWVALGGLLIGFPAGINPPESSAQSVTNGTIKLKVITFNTASKLTASDFENILKNHDPDVIVLPETSESDANRIAKETDFQGTGYGTPSSGLPETYHGGIAPTSVLVSSRLGAAHLVAGPVTSFGTVALEFDDPKLPKILGIHTAPPLPGLITSWKNDLARVIEFSETHDEPMIIAGDFNATLRHGALANRQRLLDSAQQCDPFPTGTWPAKIPGFLGSQIDHVFITPDLGATDCVMVKIGASDHAAYLTTVIVPATD